MMVYSAGVLMGLMLANWGVNLNLAASIAAIIFLYAWWNERGRKKS